MSEADWLPYEDELRDVFGFYRDVDPDPSEWFSTEDFARFTLYLEASRRRLEPREAGMRRMRRARRGV